MPLVSEFVYSIFHAAAANRERKSKKLDSPLTRYSIDFIEKMMQHKKIQFCKRETAIL